MPASLADEYIGTVLVSHFINRLTSALLDGAALAGRVGGVALVRRLAGLAVSRKVRRPLRRKGRARGSSCWRRWRRTA